MDTLLYHGHVCVQVGFGDYMEGFRSCQVDGDLLLRLTESELLDSIEMGCAITRKRWVQSCHIWSVLA